MPAFVRLRAWLQFAVVLATTAGMANAQRIRGIVRDAATGGPVPGAVVSVLDSTNQTLSRTITGLTGEFSLSRAPSAARVRAIRIGFKPSDLTLPSGESILEILMVPLPPMLERVRIVGDAVCPGRGNRTAAAFEIWEEVRAALAATVVAREANPPVVTSMHFTRELSSPDQHVVSQQLAISHGAATQPFITSVPAATLASRGYMTESGGEPLERERVYIAPDADVLLDDTFAATHCFQLRGADRSHQGQIGLMFSPAPGPGRDTIVDVQGVIWLDARRSALGSLDFRYTGLEPAAISANAGGHLSFQTMPNGVVFVEHWVLRAPILTPNAPRGRTMSPAELARRDRTTRRGRRTYLLVSRVDEHGGELLSAKWSDGTTWKAVDTGI